MDDPEQLLEDMEPGRARAVRRALAGWVEIFVILGGVMLAIAVLAASAGALLVAGTPRGMMQVVLGLMLVGLSVGVVIGQRVFVRAYARREIRRLASLPIGLVLPPYLRSLAGNHTGGKATVTVRFEGELAEKHRAKIATTVSDAIDVASMKWQGNTTLQVVSARMETRFEHQVEGRPTTFNNGRLHAWARRLVGRGLIVAHEKHPIESVRINLG